MHFVFGRNSNCDFTGHPLDTEISLRADKTDSYSIFKILSEVWELSITLTAFLHERE
jgi:hypothetical protein